MSAPIMVFLHDARHDRLRQAVAIAATATRLGRRSYLCLFYDALATFMAGSWDEPGVEPGDARGSPPWRETMIRNLQLADAPSLYEMVSKAREAGMLLYACSASARHLDLESADVGGRVDAVVGLATMLAVAGDDAQIVYI